MKGGDRPRPPAIDEGEPGSAVAVVLEAMAPSGQRLRSTLLVVVPMLIVLAIWETFRLPDAAIATFIFLMLARPDAVSTMSSSVTLSLMVSLGAVLAVVMLALSLSQPALRIPLMALATFAAMLLARATTFGPLAFVAGFFTVYGSTEADNLQGLALATPDVTNVEGYGRPAIDYFPPEEALLHALLWLIVAAIVPALLLFVANRLAGTDPLRLLLGRLRARGDAVVAFCRGKPDAADRLRALGREGIAPLLDLIGLAERAHDRTHLHDPHVRLTRGFNQLILLLVAWDMARGRDADDAPFLGGVGSFVEKLRACLDPRSASGAPAELPPPPCGTEDGLGGALPSLAAAIRPVLDRLREAAAERSRIGPADAARPPASPRKLLQPNAFGAANVRFALKVTLTVMTSYLIESGLDWQAISSAVVTCFFVALGTVGETVYKMMLRIVGCLLGGALGIGSILWLMPSMTGFGQLAVLFGAVASLSAWIAFGSPRIAYAGWQILLAFSLTTLQGFGPTLDMQTARDRVIGILLGNLVSGLVFRFVWPVSVGDAVRHDMASASGTLGEMMALEGKEASADARAAAEAGLRDSFVASVTRAGGVIPNDRFERRADPADAGDGHIGRPALGRFSRIVVPVSVIATDRVEPVERDGLPPRLRDAVGTYHRDMTAWFAAAGAWLRTGENRDRLRATLPRPPSIGDAAADEVAPALARRVRGRLALYDLLHRQVADFLDEALPANPTRPAPAETERSVPLAAG